MRLIHSLHRLVASTLLLSFCVLSFSLVGCRSEKMSADTPDSGSVAVDSTDESSQKSEPTDSDTPEQAEPVDSSTEDPGSPEAPLTDTSIAVLGNSMVESLYVYNVLPEADLFYKIGLNVTTVFTKSCVNGTGPAIEELSKKTYDDVILIFGMNELGWNQNTFIQDYQHVIEQVKQYQPQAKIYIHSVTPVSEKVDAKADNGITNDRIRLYNEALKQLAQQNGVLYLDVGTVFYTQTGTLAPEASVDGIHPEIEYSRRWADYIRKCLKGDGQQ